MTTQHDDISGRAMLADLRISRWTARKLDRRATSEVAKNHQLQSQSGRYYKTLIEGAAFDNTNDIATKARAYHYRMTLPWSDVGPRVLANEAYFEYAIQMQDFGQQFQTSVDALLTEYPYYREEAKRLLGSLFNEDDYPPTYDLSHRFGFKLNILPLPVASDFRAQIGDEERDRIRKEIEIATNETVRRSVGEAYTRLAKVCEAFVDRLGDPKRVFHDSLVNNAKDLAEVLPKLNFTKDPQLDVLAQRLNDELCRYEPATLRTDPAARSATHRAARQINKDLMGFFGGGL